MSTDRIDHRGPKETATTLSGRPVNSDLLEQVRALEHTLCKCGAQATSLRRRDGVAVALCQRCSGLRRPYGRDIATLQAWTRRVVAR